MVRNIVMSIGANFIIIVGAHRASGELEPISAVWGWSPSRV